MQHQFGVVARTACGPGFCSPTHQTYHSSRPQAGTMHTMQLSKQVCRCSTSAAATSRSSTLVARAMQQQQQAVTLSPAGTLALSLAAAATAVQLVAPAPAPAAIASTQLVAAESARYQPVVSELSVAAAPSLEAAAEAEAEDVLNEMTEDVALPPELMRFMELITSGPVKNADKLQEARRSVGFERSPDGRVMLLTEDGEPFQVKADMGVPGMLLLRDAGGYVYYLPADEEGSLPQIDLSDDAVVAQLFANHAWEELVEPLEVLADDVDPQAAAANADGEGPAGRLEQLRLTERQFRSVVSLIAGGQELPEEPLEQLDGQEQQ